MDSDPAALPDDIDALKATLTNERVKMRELAAERDAGAAELAVARAKASEEVALIAHQKLRIAKLERQLYGPRSERSSQLIDQMALQFEELEASATEDELAAEMLSPRLQLSRGSPANALSETLFLNTFLANVWSSRRRPRVTVVAVSGFASLART
jgi:transposase